MAVTTVFFDVGETLVDETRAFEVVADAAMRHDLLCDLATRLWRPVGSEIDVPTGADRARAYGIPEDKLGEFYAQRTLLKQEVLPEHCAQAVFVLCSPELSRTTGLHIPVDSGVAAAFLR